MQRDTPNLEIAAHLDKTFHRLKSKDAKQFKILSTKIDQVLLNPEHFKPLRGDLSGSRRIHVGKSLVLIYEYNKQKNLVRILHYGYHEEIF